MQMTLYGQLYYETTLDMLCFSKKTNRYEHLRPISMMLSPMSQFLNTAGLLICSLACSK